MSPGEIHQIQPQINWDLIPRISGLRLFLKDWVQGEKGGKIQEFQQSRNSSLDQTGDTGWAGIPAVPQPPESQFHENPQKMPPGSTFV